MDQNLIANKLLARANRRLCEGQRDAANTEIAI